MNSPSGFKVAYCSHFNLISVILLVVQGSMNKDTEEPLNQTTHGQKEKYIGECQHHLSGSREKSKLVEKQADIFF